MSAVRTWIRCLGLTLLVTLAASRPGLAMNDPTRPSLPAGRAGAAQPALAPSLPAQAVASASAPEPMVPQLQSLHLPQQGPATALVDGQLLRVGDKLGQHTVTAIDAQGISVQGPAGRQRWTLLGVEYLDPAQARRAAARRLPPEATASSELSVPVPSLGAGAAATPARVPLERYREAVPASTPAATGARRDAEWPLAKPASRPPAAAPVPPQLHSATKTPGLQSAVGWSPAPPHPAALQAGASVVPRWSAWQPASPAQAVARPGLPRPDAEAAMESPPAAAGAVPWADLIAPPEHMARLVARRLAADADLSRWQTVRQLPQLASTRLPHARGTWVHTAMQPRAIVPERLRRALSERPWQAATPSGRAAVNAAQQVLLLQTLEQLHQPALTPGASARLLPLALVQARLVPAPSRMATLLPSTPPQTALQPALKLRMTLELDPVPSRPARQAAQVKETS